MDNNGRYYAPTSAEAERRWTAVIPLTPSEALNSATAHMLREGFSLESRTEMSATFSKHEGPEPFLGCILLLFFIIPGLIYLLMGGSDQRVTLFLRPEGEWSRVVLGGDSGRGRLALQMWAEEQSRGAPGGGS
jgi:hypothetical protein